LTSGKNDLRREDQNRARRAGAHERNFLSRPHDAFLVCAPEFRNFAASGLKTALEETGLTNTSINTDQLDHPHFLPPSIRLHNLKFRQLLQLIQKVPAVQTIWWEVSSHKRVTHAQSLRSALDAISWQNWFPSEANLRFAAESQRSTIRQSAALRGCAEAASESQQCQKVPRSPASTLNTVPIKLSLLRDTLKIYAPLTMAPLHHRAYKTELDHPAGLREDLAQGLILSLAEQMHIRGFAPAFQTPGNGPNQSPHDSAGRHLKLLLPFAGTGTFAFEAATLFWKLDHCLVGRYELLKRCSVAPLATLAHLSEAAANEARSVLATHSVSVCACDTHEPALAQSRATEASFLRHMQIMTGSRSIPWTSHWTHEDFFHWQAPDLRARLPQAGPEPVVCLLNPPFGLRLKVASAPAFFGRIGHQLVQLAHAFTEGMVGTTLCPDAACAESFAKSLQSKGCEHRILSLSYGGLKARMVEFFFRPRSGQ
jgi:23S rRNA G2445 N2-methylase RlmL